MATTTARSIARRASAMPAFDYAALDERGQTRHGRIDAADPGTARSQLERQRLVPVRVEPASARTAPAPRKAIGSAFDRFTTKRSEERRVGKEGVSKCRSQGAPYR